MTPPFAPIPQDEAASFIMLLGLKDTDRTVFPIVEALFWDRRLVPGTPRADTQVGICTTSTGLILLSPSGALDLPLDEVQVASATYGGQGFLLMRNEGKDYTFSMPKSVVGLLVDLLVDLGASQMAGKFKGRKIATDGSAAWA